MNIVLTGFMGCGKTTLGKWLADSKNMQFIDTDEYIVECEKKSVNDIFAQDGEGYFRNLETEVIKSLIDKLDNTVIAVGGGLPVKPENRLLLKKLGSVVYLDTSKEELIRRLKNSKDRPMLAGVNLAKRVDELMIKRKDIYIDGADFIIKTDGKEFGQIYDEIMEGIKIENFSN